MHGKATAKANRNRLNATTPGLFGNDLDFHYQRSNSNHTKGIPIGPDPSFVIAEAVLTACDASLASKVPGLVGFRIYDDYELCFDTLEHAEHTLAVLQATLAEYELALNPRKTKIVPLPDHLGDEFVGALAQYNFGTEPASQAYVLIGYFDWVFAYAKTHPDEQVINYAVGRFKKEAIAPANWEMLIGLLLQAAHADSSAWANVVEILDGAYKKGMPIPKPVVERAANATMLRHAPCGHSSEVAWCLWLVLRLRMGIYKEVVAVLGLGDDRVAALLVLDAEVAGLLQGTLDKTKWQGRMTTQDLKSDQWLLAYEAFKLGWLASPSGTDHVAVDVEFNWLRNQGVSFYEPVAAAVVTPHKPKTVHAVAPKLPATTPTTEPSMNAPIAPAEPQLTTEPQDDHWYYR